MRRLFANLALGAVLSTLVLPLTLALQTSGTPACCLPGGKHHCNQKPTGAGFRSQTDACPYASQFVATSFTAVQLDQLKFAGPEVSSSLGSTVIRAGHRITIRPAADRGPPALSR